MTDNCPCHGQHTSDRWHTKRGLPRCDTVREQRARVERERQRTRKRKPKQLTSNVRTAWLPGTSIFVPEIDPL